jgi:8-oxo-dGTP pyrophosphatase MutT (NUDIX family)
VTTTEPAPPRSKRAPHAAATVVLLRDGEGKPEVFLLRRAGGAGFMANATVFPGGKVDAQDHELGPALSVEHTASIGHALDSDIIGVLGNFGAAVRELCEEAGVVLARTDTGAIVAPEVAAAVAAAVTGERDGHRVPAAAFRRALHSHGLVADMSAVAPFAWWVTPHAEPVRFNTLFFCAVLPAGQSAAVDGVEGTEGQWVTAQAAIAIHNAGGRQMLPPPTLHTLLRIAALAGDAAAVCAALAARSVGPMLMPHFVAEGADGPHGKDGPFIAMPDDPAHPDASPMRRAWARSSSELKRGECATART